MQHEEPKNDTSADSGSKKEIMQKEKLIDPGNEHHHQKEDDKKKEEREDDETKEEIKPAEGDGDDGITKPQPGTGEIKKEPFDTSGEDG